MANNEGGEEFDFDVATEAITKNLAGVAAELRTLSTQQVDLWKLVPYRALLAQHRGSHSRQYELAYQQGLWPLAQDRKGVLTWQEAAAIDLNTGRIVRESNPSEPARDGVVIRIAARSLVYLHAGGVLESLDAKIASTPLGRTEEELAQWQAAEARAYGVTEIYDRQQASEAPAFEAQRRRDLEAELSDWEVDWAHA